MKLNPPVHRFRSTLKDEIKIRSNHGAGSVKQTRQRWQRGLCNFCRVRSLLSTRAVQHTAFKPLSLGHLQESNTVFVLRIMTEHLTNGRWAAFRKSLSKRACHTASKAARASSFKCLPSSPRMHTVVKNLPTSFVFWQDKTVETGAQLSAHEDSRAHLFLTSATPMQTFRRTAADTCVRRIPRLPTTVVHWSCRVLEEKRRQVDAANTHRISPGRRDGHK